jgi:hypothetical protein
MGRPDGRIEKGQRLGSAISARAWNRAQDAADVVLGVTPGFEAEAGPPDRVDYVTVSMTKAAVDTRASQWPDHIEQNAQGHKLHVGFALPLEFDDLSIGPSGALKANLSDLRTFESAAPWINAQSFYYNSERFGVITDVSVAPATENTPERYMMKMAVGGVFTCRCLAFALTTRLIGPVSVPGNPDVRPLWYPYPVASPAGSVRVLAYGNYVRLTNNAWPRIYEVMVRM